jgi:hypothetical protein
MRERGKLSAVNPGDPRLHALLEGVETEAQLVAAEEEFVGVALQAVEKGAGWAWVLAVVERRRGEAGAMRARGSAPAQPIAARPAWETTDRGCRAMAEQLGVQPRVGEGFDVWLQRIRLAWDRAGKPELRAAAA